MVTMIGTKILEYSAMHGYLWKHLAIAGVVCALLLVLYVARRWIGEKGVVACFLLGWTGLGVYLYREYALIRYLYHTSIPAEASLEFMLEQDLEPAEFLSDFEEVDRYIRKQRWYRLDVHKGLSLEQLYQVYRRQVERAGTKKEYFDVLQRYFCALQNVHTRLYYRKYQSPAQAEWRGDSLYVTFSQWDIPLHVGDRILKIDGKEVLAWRDSMIHYVSASTDRSRQLLTAEYAFASYTDTLRVCTLMHGDSLYTTRIPLYRDYYQEMAKAFQEEQQRPKKREPLSEESFYRALAQRFSRDYQVLELRNFREYDVEHFLHRLQRHQACRNLILDLSSNQGGRVRLVHEVARHLLKKPYVTTYKNTLIPHSDAYSGKLFVLVSRYTASAAENLASLLQESGSAVLVGEETSGDFGTYNMTFCTSHGTLFAVGAGNPKMTAAGRIAEGEWLQPDIRVIPHPGQPVSRAIRDVAVRLVSEDLDSLPLR